MGFYSTMARYGILDFFARLARSARVGDFARMARLETLVFSRFVVRWIAVGALLRMAGVLLSLGPRLS